METENAPYRMAISLNAIKNLGINLYSSIPAVLSEVVANAWDADAENINIKIESDKITITDDGSGMTKQEVNDRYLLVGYDKRNDTDNPYARETPKGRAPMGRKGIGKLSVFSIANEVEVQTVKGDGRAGFVMKIEAILDAINSKDGRAVYHPEPIEDKNISVMSGTYIELRRLKKRTGQAEKPLRRRLSRRFGVLTESDFNVTINGAEVTVADRDYFDRVEFLWLLGAESEHYANHARNAKAVSELSSKVNDEFSVSGWIGTVDVPSAIEDPDTTLVLMARGKLIQENLLRSLQETGIYAEYVVGEINADFLDEDGDDDIITSDRQRIKEDDPRVEKLFAYLEPLLGRIRREWDEKRRAVGVEKARQNPVLAEWLDQYQGDIKVQAEKMLSKIETLRLPDEESKKELYKASIVGFERLALQQELSKLNSIETERDFELLKILFGNVEELEAFHYYQIVKTRLDVIEKFANILPNAKEKVIQEYLFKNLWLLDPSWERASTNQRVEETVTKEFDDIGNKLSDDERRGRLDIRYKTAAGKHIIVELKKYDRHVKVLELAEQVQKYINALDKVLETYFPEEPRTIEAICVIGSKPIDETERNKDILKTLGARYITYDTLIRQTQDSYEEYLEGQKKFSRIMDIVNRLFEPSNEEMLATGKA